MNKILAMRQERADLINQARQLVEKAENEKRDLNEEEQKQYDNYMNQIEELKNKIEREEKLEALESELNEPMNTIRKPQPNVQKVDNKEVYTNAFFKAIAGKKLNAEEQNALMEFNNAMSEGVGEDGGYTVPEDIQTRIQELKQTQDNLEQYVSVEKVNTNSGARTLEVRADSTPFVSVDEMAELDDMGSPKFQRITYQIKKYAGFMQVSNELFADTAENLREYIANWLAKKSKATRNNLILNVLKGLTKVDLADYNGIKRVLNVDLDPAISQNASIFTNQDGFNYLDQLEDNEGRPLLQPDPTQPTRKLFAGKPVVVLSNKTLASAVDGDNVSYPFIIGDLKEAVVLFDRKLMTVETTREGGESWRKDLTEIRAIEREDVKLRDDEAVVYGQITITVA